MAKTRNSIPKKSQPIDLSYARAATLMLPVWDRIRLVLVGCGGTGSWLAPSVARIARLQRDQGREVEVTFCDHDHVEPKNIPRQHFCDAELNRNKAVTLAGRYSAAWGVEISAVPKKFRAADFYHHRNALMILIGCVDNAAARGEISKVIGGAPRDGAHAWWLDCGNDESSGQVIVGSHTHPGQLEGAFTPSCKICKRLPAPSLVAPDLLDPRPEELLASKLSCAEIQMANAQSLAVNQMVASLATDYLLRLVSGGLKRFATFFDLSSGSMRSRYITADEVARVVGKPASYLISEAKERRKAA
ncbi:MAG TPA: ThiF family adenylyltransferase [Blastocatellia bacterium]|nr:ThiF family adenylyltransferase [Blastocatellia bacterium]